MLIGPNTIHNKICGIVNGSCMVLGPTTVLPRVTGLNTIDTQHAVPLATFYNIDARVRTDAVVIEQPLDVDG